MLPAALRNRIEIVGRNSERQTRQAENIVLEFRKTRSAQKSMFREGVQLKYRNIEYYKDFKTDTSESLSMLLGMPSMTLYITILMYHTLEARLKDSARDTSIEWRNILIYSRQIS